jgi:hypothetical protein
MPIVFRYSLDAFFQSIPKLLQILACQDERVVLDCTQILSVLSSTLSLICHKRRSILYGRQV